MSVVYDKAIKDKSTFVLSYSISAKIKATPDKVWKILITADKYTKWNSTVISLDGKIAEGEKIKLTVKISPRVFSLKVCNVIPEKSMVWKDGMPGLFTGVRTYNLSPENEYTVFSMAETFSGLMLPMIAGSLPDFSSSFEEFARDLKTQSENFDTF